MWDQKDCVDYLKTSAVLAAYIDQSLSTNTFYNPAHFTSDDPQQDRKVPGTLIAKNLMLAYKWGLKTVYYSLINKVGAKEGVTATTVTTQVVSVNAADNVTLYDDDCEACKL
jgi:ribonucleoside-diphosphate reductase alpha chain